MSERKCVVVVDSSLPAGIIANTVAVLSMSLGKMSPELVGADLVDGDGVRHAGITTIAIAVLKSDGPMLTQMRRRARTLEPELAVVDVISATRSTKSYEQYAAALQQLREDEIQYFGLAICGDRKLVTGLTGSLALLR